MCLAGARATDQHDVALLGDEPAAGEVIDQRLVDRRVLELEVIKILGKRQFGDAELVLDRASLLLGDRGGANAAAAVAGEPPSGDVIPVSADDPLTTARTVRALAPLVMDIPGVDEMQPYLARDIASPRQGDGRRTGQIQHVVVRVEGGEMQGHVRS